MARKKDPVGFRSVDDRKKTRSLRRDDKVFERWAIGGIVFILAVQLGVLALISWGLFEVVSWLITK
jgi:hypothetical protein